MTEERKHAASGSAREQALAWVVRLQSGDPTAADRENLERWLQEHPAHRQEFERYTSIWNNLDQTPPLLASELSQAEAYWEEQAPAKAWARRGVLTRWGQSVAAAGAVAATVLLMVWWWPQVTVPEQVYHTAKGEQRTITLPEGSTIVMNTDSTLSVQVSEDDRIVTLQRGEALFTVAHDESRPFDVHAGNGVIHDIGTRFLVRKFPKKVQVAVLEGIVEVGLKEVKDSYLMPTPQVLRKGDQVFYTAESHISQVEGFAVKPAMAWVEGKLIFVEKPLADVLKEWARYRPEEIRLRDPGLGTLPVSGVFRIDNIGSFFKALEEALAIHPVQRSPKLVILERKAAA